MNNILLKNIKIIPVLLVAVLFLWLLNKNFPAGRQIEIKAVLGKDQPAISMLGPAPRLKQQNNYQLILDSPVYFDLRVLPWFYRAQISIIYQEKERKLLGVGGKVGGEWDYDVKKPLLVNQLAEGWRQAVFIFNLNSLRQEKNVFRFLIDSAGEPSEPLKIREIKIILQR